MSDRNPPKAKKAKKARKPHTNAKPRVDASKLKPLKGVGHNSVLPELVNIVDEILASDARVKNEGLLKRDLRNRAKTEFGVLSSVLAHEIRLRKMDKDVRVQFEASHTDLKTALGYQIELPFDAEVSEGGTVHAPTEAPTEPAKDTAGNVVRLSPKSEPTQAAQSDDAIIIREG